MASLTFFSLKNTSACTALILSLMFFSQALLPPAAHAGLFGDFTVEDERELGQKYYTLIKSRYPVVEDPEIVGYITDVVNRVADTLPPIPYDITTTVIRNNSINAFATPAGYVYIFTGLVQEFDTESELAGVIAHELAHVTQRHVAKRIEKQQIAQLGLLAGMLAGFFLGQGGGENQKNAGTAVMAGTLAGTTSAMLKYSREDEREADQVGMNYLTSAGYNPHGMSNAFKKIRHKQRLSGSSIPPYMSTHPAADERISYLDGRIQRLPDVKRNPRIDNSRFSRIKTLVTSRFGDADKSLSIFSDTDTALANMGRGIVHLRKKRVAAAGENFERAVELAPNDPLILREAGRYHYKVGDAQKAQAYLFKAALKNPDDLIALFYLARLEADKGKTKQAVKYYKRILKQIPEDSEVHYHLGRTLGESGDAFGGHLHLAYWGLYSLNQKQAKTNLARAKKFAKTEEENKRLAKLEEVFKSRAEFW